MSCDHFLALYIVPLSRTDQYRFEPFCDPRLRLAIEVSGHHRHHGEN